MPRLSAEQRESVPRRYLAGAPSNAIAVSLGVSPEAVRGILKRRGVALRSQREAQAKRAVCHDAFRVLTADASYWCGFFAADGTIVGRTDGSPEIALHIAQRDREHVEAFRSFLGSTHAIVQTAPGKGTYEGSTGGVRLSVRSAPLAARLAELGVKRGPLSPDLAVSRDFWRGAVDGDGYIGVSSGVAQFKLVGQRWLIQEFCDYVTRLGLRLSALPHRSIYVAATTGRGAETIICHLYDVSDFGLTRKVNAARNIDARRAVTARGGRREADPVNREPQLLLPTA